MLKDKVVFFREFIQETETTGSFFPTSKHAAQALTAPLRESRKSKAVLELGPGTGSVTVKILADLGPNDVFDICEINPRFMATLKKSLRKNADFIKHQDRINFHTCAAQELQETKKYDVIVCALPFLNFPVDVVKEIYGKLVRLSHEETVMTYYEYIGLRRINLAIAGSKKRQQMKEIEEFYTDIAKRMHRTSKKIWLNVLPISVYRLYPNYEGSSSNEINGAAAQAA